MKYGTRHARKASITVEVALTAVLSLTVLFLVLGLFSQNLQAMAEGSNINNLFNKKHIATTYNSFDKNYQNSQVNVQIVGEQGLETKIAAYHDSAQKAIETLATKPSLTTQDKVNLAKYLTIFAESGTEAPQDTLEHSYMNVKGMQKQYSQIASDNSINIVFDDGDGNYYTKANGTVYNWNNINKIALPGDTDAQRISNIQVIDQRIQ